MDSFLPSFDLDTTRSLRPFYLPTENLTPDPQVGHTNIHQAYLQIYLWSRDNQLNKSYPNIHHQLGYLEIGLEYIWVVNKCLDLALDTHNLKVRYLSCIIYHNTTLQSNRKGKIVVKSGVRPLIDIFQGSMVKLM